EGHVPRGPVLPAARRRDRAAAAPRAPRRHSDPRRGPARQDHARPPQGGPLCHADGARPARRLRVARQRARAREHADPRGRAREDGRPRRDAAAGRRRGCARRSGGGRRRSRRRRRAADAARDRAPPHHPRARAHRVEQAPRVRDPRHQPADARSQDRGVRPAQGRRMIGGVVALAIAAVGAAYAGLVIKADPHRRDNLMFGALALTDASMTAWRGINVLSGDSIVTASVTLPCSLATIVLAVFTIEFVYAFPRRAAMTWPWRIALLAWAAAGALVTVLCDWHGEW